MKRNQNGFTIIEVIIVLAIAGLMLAIIFGAFPAFNRNSHNNQRKQDVAYVLDRLSQYELNNSGNMPPNAGTLNLTELVYFIPTSVTVNSGNSLPSIAGNTNLNTMRVFNYQKCDVNANGRSTHTGAGYNDVVALYAIETSNNNVPKCQQL